MYTHLSYGLCVMSSIFTHGTSLQMIVVSALSLHSDVNFYNHISLCQHKSLNGLILVGVGFRTVFSLAMAVLASTFIALVSLLELPSTGMIAPKYLNGLPRVLPVRLYLD